MGGDEGDSRGVPEGQQPAVFMEKLYAKAWVCCVDREDGERRDRKGPRLYFATVFSIWDNDL